MSASPGVASRPVDRRAPTASRRRAPRRPLADLARVVAELELVAGHSLQEYREGLYVHRAAERLVQLGVDLACELGLEALQAAGRRLPGGHAETFRELGKAGLLPEGLATKMEAAADLRRALLYDAGTEPDAELHGRLLYLAVLLREYGRSVESLGGRSA